MVRNQCQVAIVWVQKILIGKPTHEKWVSMQQLSELLDHCSNSLGLVDEFALMSRLKENFSRPLHCTVTLHLSHKGNVERVFSGAKTRADAKMCSSMLQLVTKTGVNKKRYKPTVAAIWARCKEKHNGLSMHTNTETDCCSSDSSSDSDSD